MKKKKSFTLVEIMIVVAIIALLAAIALPGLLRSRLNAQESAAQANLQVIAGALESYAAANDGKYPTSETSLTGANPPYLNKAYCGQSVSGYTYSCSLSNTTYTVTATPTTCGVTGKRIFNITTGGVLNTQGECS